MKISRVENRVIQSPCNRVTFNSKLNSALLIPEMMQSSVEVATAYALHSNTTC